MEDLTYKKKRVRVVLRICEDATRRIVWLKKNLVTEKTLAADVWQLRSCSNETGIPLHLLSH
jgi:hypothetical protein